LIIINSKNWGILVMGKRMINEMMTKILNNKKTINSIIDIIDIKNSGEIILKDESEYVMFKREDMFDNFVLSDNEFFERSFNIAKHINRFEDFQSFSLLIKLDSVDYNFRKYMTQKREYLPFFDEYKKHKYDQFKNRKHIKIYGGCQKKYSNKIQLFLEDMKFEKMDGVEAFSFLYDHFNLDKRRNSGRSLPKHIVKKLKDPSISLMRILYDSYIEDMHNYIAIGDYYVKLYEVTYPPQNLNINKLLADLHKMDSNVMINIHFTKSDSYRNILTTKKNRTKGALLSTLTSINYHIQKNIEKMEEFLDKYHMTTTECTITVALYNKSLQRLEEDMFDLKEWSDAHFMFDRYRSIQSYFELIPGLKKFHQNGLYLSSLHQSQLLLASNYDTKPSSSLFVDMNDYVHIYNFIDPKKSVNSGLISAPTGRGKSVLLNYIYFQFFIHFGKKLNSFILDYGGSYKNLVNGLNEELKDEEKIVYKTLSVDSDEKINIFDLEYGKEINDKVIRSKISLLIHFFKAAFKNSLDEGEEVLLDVALQETYKHILFDDDYKKYDLSSGNYDNRKFYIDRYIESGYQDIDSFLNAMPTIHDLVKILSSIQSIRNSFSEDVRKSLVEKISNFSKISSCQMFMGKSTSIVTNKHVVIDIKPLVGADKSGYLATLFFIYYAQSRYMRFIDPDIKDEHKLMLIDEYPRMLKATPAIEEFVDMLLKTGRKEHIDTFLVSQNVNTYHPDFFENIGNVIVFKPNTPSEIDKIKSVLGVNEDFIEIANNIKTIKGKYSEIMIISINGENIEKTVVKFELNDWDKRYFTI